MPDLALILVACGFLAFTAGAVIAFRVPLQGARRGR